MSLTKSYLINGPNFNGYATVIPYDVLGVVYNGNGSTFLLQFGCPTPTHPCR